MISMTGYAKHQFVFGNKNFSIEIKTLNSKQLDLNVKLPLSLRNADIPMRSLLSQLERGKVDVLVTEESSTTVSSVFNVDVANAKLEQLKKWTDALGKVSDDVLVGCIARQSDVWCSASDADVSDDFHQSFLREVQVAIDAVVRFRADEGAVLERDFIKHVDAIEAKLGCIDSYEAERIDTAKQRIYRYFEEFAISDIDRNRFEQELIYYLEKLDITEEKVRLQKHIDFFRTTMQTESVCGKKLAFIAQEMGREINTTGSKANHVDIQRLVVEMKDELEKIKEQLGNIL
ncbi:MAG: YicC family protein [Bacteroidales bacterium]|nr:YicC family protein [Candidatus Colimorpha onthohippi]